ncbi:MAG: biopolymer transporter ExbD [Gammaproteobacteria bacterium]|nr:biopolymer transporter ExbD [Gammaproteobacteria bacterium]
MNFKPESAEGVEVNLTPLIDVVFLLLIFFMVTTTFSRESTLKINLPEATEQSQPQEDIPLELMVDAAGAFYINGRAVVNSRPQTLVAALSKAAAEHNDPLLTIRADARTPHQSVITAMDSAARIGLSRISIATTKMNDGSPALSQDPNGS